MIGLDPTVLIAHELTEAPLNQQVRSHIALVCCEKGTWFGLAPKCFKNFSMWPPILAGSSNL